MENLPSLKDDRQPAERAASERLAEVQNRATPQSGFGTVVVRFVAEAGRTGLAALHRARRGEARDVRPGVASWLGWASAFLFFVGGVTGVFLMFHYRPTVEHAYEDVLALRDMTTPGILRELHRWGAHALVVTVCLHLYRIVLAGKYQSPRGWNWGVGVSLLVLTLLLSLTGHLLPWDQNAYWGVAVTANAAAGAPVFVAAASGPDASGTSPVKGTLGGSVLNLFYVLHCVVIPLAAVHLIRYHIRRARQDHALDRPV